MIELQKYYNTGGRFAGSGFYGHVVEVLEEFYSEDYQFYFVKIKIYYGVEGDKQVDAIPYRLITERITDGIYIPMSEEEFKIWRIQ
jgi:hypothetical protein